MGKLGQPPEGRQLVPGPRHAFFEQPRLEPRSYCSKVRPRMDGPLCECPWKAIGDVIQSLRCRREQVGRFRPAVAELLQPFRSPGSAADDASRLAMAKFGEEGSKF